MYQLSILSGTVSRDMICFMSGVEIPAAKKLMRTLWSMMPVQMVLLWKVEMYPSVFLSHLMGGEPGDGISSSVLVFKSLLEPSKEVVPGPEGYSGPGDCILLEGVGSQGGPFSHV